MKKPDTFLVGIVAGVVLLVVAAFAVALLRPKAGYQPEDKPEGVAFNYLFALQQKDYERAYGYLSPSIRGYPSSASAFMADVNDNSWTFQGLNNTSTTLEIESTNITGKTAIVKIKETHFYESGLFDSGEYTNFFDVTLQQEANGDWKLTHADNYWLNCWKNSKGCN